MAEQYKKYDITQCALYKCKSAQKLKKILRITATEYKDIALIAKYHEFQIDKKDGVEKEALLHQIKE